MPQQPTYPRATCRSRSSRLGTHSCPRGGGKGERATTHQYTAVYDNGTGTEHELRPLDDIYPSTNTLGVSVPGGKLYTLARGQKRYETANHAPAKLGTGTGNVLATISDRKACPERGPVLSAAEGYKTPALSAAPRAPTPRM